MSELIPPTTEIIGVENAFQQWTHFLDERGIHKHKIGRQTAIPEIVPSSPDSNRYEVAWMHTEHHARIHIDIFGQEGVLTSERRTIGKLLLATMRNKDGSYEFAPIEELGQADDLPLYTAAWLSRYIKTWGRDSFGILNHPIELHAITDKPAMQILDLDQVRQMFPDPKNEHEDRRSDDELRSIARDERAKRLAQLVITHHPHLEQWYKSRGIQ